MKQSGNNKFTEQESLDAIKEWKASAALRTEYGNDFQAFLGYKSAVKAGAVTINGVAAK